MPEFSLTPDLLSLLKNKPAFQNVLKQLKDEGLEIKDIKERHLLSLSEDLCQTARNGRDQHPVLKGKDGVRKDGVGARTLQEIFTGKYRKKKYEGRVKRTIHSVVYYITGLIEPEGREQYIFGKARETPIPDPTKIAPQKTDPSTPAGHETPKGFWYVYRYYNHEGMPPLLKRTILHIGRDQEGGSKASYRSVDDNIYEGTLTPYQKIFTINLADGNRSIEISSCTLDGFGLNGDKVINAIIRSTGSHHRPDAGHCILMQAGKELRSLEEARVFNVYHSAVFARNPSRKKKDDFFHRKLDPIVIYLSRNNAPKMIAKTFEPSTINTIEQRNAAFFGNDYFDRHLQLWGTWYSLSPLSAPRGMLTGMTWSFEFDQASRKCTLFGKRIGESNTFCHGTVEFQPNSFTCLLTDNSKNPVIHLVARIRLESNRIDTLATSLTDDPHMAWRMMFFRGPKLDIYEQALLADERSNHLCWPAQPDHDQREIEALKKFTGYWYAYIPYVYDAPKRKFSRIILHIDELGKVTETLYDSFRQKGDRKVVYHGHATILRNTLRLSNINMDEQKSEYLLEINMGAPSRPDHLKGITLDTDRSGLPCADACIAFRPISPWSSLPTEPKIIDRKSKDYPLLRIFFNKHFHTSPEQFFYEHQKSIRDIKT